MMKIAVFGGTGRTGLHVMRRALAEGHEVVVLARTPAKMTIQDKNLTVIVGDVTDRTAVTQTIASADAVISALSPNLTGVQNIIAAMQEREARRLIVTSGAGVKRAGDEPTFSSKIISGLIKTFSRQVYEESLAIADAVQNSGLAWTLVRAPRLVDKPAVGNLYIGPLNKNMKTTLSREDFANFLVTAVTDNAWIGKSPVLSDR
ncbi:MAG: NAD(P)H-binding protein [Anaerolineae bacterium]|nr:NAD(P)H-binding protein [Anaerolineae bacterium]